jgi:hypothetical protein
MSKTLGNAWIAVLVVVLCTTAAGIMLLVPPESLQGGLVYKGF